MNNELPVMVVVFIGLPASGKSNLAKSLYDCFGDRYGICDDVSRDDILDDLVVASGYPFYHGIIIIDQSLCLASARKVFEKTLENFRYSPPIYIAFNNDMFSCLKNARQRLTVEPAKKVLGRILRLNKLYTIPEGATILPVWKEGVEYNLANLW